MSSHSVLLLGAGSVAKPTLEALTKANIHVTVACRTLSSAKELVTGFNGATPISLDAADEKALDEAVSKHDLIISLIPYTLHALVIKSAIRWKKHVVTTSYVSPSMQELDQQCKDAGITVMNEIGLDPGLDHLYAIKTIDEVHNAGGQIISFKSYCGGLPAPGASNNPLGYKFSWSPRGVLLALRNTAKYWDNRNEKEVVGKELMGEAKPYYIWPAFAYVAYPNRDSTPYKERYGIPEAQTIVRGTLRYQGFPQFIRVLVEIGFLEDREIDTLKSPVTWREATQAILGTASSDARELVDTVLTKGTFETATVGVSEKERIIAGLKWIGIFSDEKISPRGNPLDCLCAALEQKMQYQPGERDSVMLQHKFEILHANGQKETRTSTLYDEGNVTGGWSAMARLVGYPCAEAVKLVLNGTIADNGILAPVNIKLAEPLMKVLKETYDIELKEESYMH